MQSEPGAPRRRTSRLAVTACIIGLLAPVALFCGYSFGQYGIRRFELYTRVLRAQLAGYALLFIGGAIWVALLVIVLGHVAGRRIRRRSSLIGEGWARAAYVLGYGTLIVYVFFLHIPVTDWPPLISTSEDRAIGWLESLNWAAREYAAAAKKRGFPEALEEFNRIERTKSTAAWLAGLQAQLAESYRLSYRPAARDASGVINEYLAEATPVQPGQSTRASFFIDSTGILRWTSEARGATAQDPEWRARRSRPSTTATEAAMSDARVTSILRVAVGCAAAYAILNPQRGVPHDAAEMGPQMARCLDADVTGKQLGLRFVYQPALPGADGRVSAFELHVRPSVVGRASARSFVVNETGIIRATSENRAARQSDSIVYSPPVTPAQEAVQGFENMAASWLQGLHDCLASYAQKDRLGGLPLDLSALRPPKSDCTSPEIASRKLHGYVFSYLPGAADARGRFQSYTIFSRPLRFGETGKLSFYTDETGVIRQTAENRAARASDPPRASGVDPQANEQIILDRIKLVRTCALSFAENADARTFPESLTQLGPSGTGCASAQIVSGQERGYVLTYSLRRSATGQGNAGFVLIAFPVRHGWTGIRSFLADESGVIRATRIHRLPRADDPVVETLKK